MIDNTFNNRYIRFVVPGEPQGKARPRVVNGHAYTPTQTAAYEDLIRMAYKMAEPGRQAWEAGKAIAIVITAHYQIPKSASKTAKDKMRNWELLPLKKPDLDNIGKAVADALNGIAYKDDAQIAELRIRKIYNDAPKLIVELYEIETKE